MTPYSLDVLHSRFELVHFSMSCSNCCFLTCIQISQEVGKVVWYSHLLKNFPVCCDPHKGFGRVNKADVFLELSCFFNDPTDVGNLIFGYSSLNMWKFMVHVLVKPDLENFDHYFTSVWDECNCAAVWAFFSIAFLWDWNENWPFPGLWYLHPMKYYSAIKKTITDTCNNMNLLDLILSERNQTWAHTL